MLTLVKFQHTVNCVFIIYKSSTFKTSLIQSGFKIINEMIKSALNCHKICHNSLLTKLSFIVCIEFNLCLFFLQWNCIIGFTDFFLCIIYWIYRVYIFTKWQSYVILKLPEKIIPHIYFNTVMGNSGRTS